MAAAMVGRAGQSAKLNARLVDVPIDRIRVPDPADGVESTATQALEVHPGADRIVNLLRPPLLVPDEDQPGHYLVVGNRPTFLRQLQLAGTDATRSRTLTAIVLKPCDSKRATVAPVVDEYLVPLVFGGLTVRQKADARRKLRAVGLSPPRPIKTRAAVRRLVKPPATDDDA